MALLQPQPSIPTEPQGCQACCSGTPFPTEVQYDVTAVEM